DLAHGNGRLTPKSGAFGELPVTWASRTERSDGKTSPEELLAAAHASCFAMALSNGLTQGGHKPDRLEIGAVCTLDRLEAGLRGAALRPALALRLRPLPGAGAPHDALPLPALRLPALSRGGAGGGRPRRLPTLRVLVGARPPGVRRAPPVAPQHRAHRAAPVA